MRITLSALAFGLALPAAAQDATRNLENVAGDVWRAWSKTKNRTYRCDTLR